jgi:hyaluronoglucosaminidase
LKSFYDVHLFEDLIANPAINEIERDTYLKLYNDMDKVAYFNKERGFAFGISMYSNKIQNYEFMNKENAKGWYTSDGVSYLYNDDLSHFSDDYWATVDPYKLTGITENSEIREKGSGMTTMKNSFVGSTSLENQFATVAMDFTNWNNTLSAKKSWFILGDRVVFLGSGVKDSSGKDVYTVVENRKIKRESRNRRAGQEDYKVFVNGTETTIGDKDSPAQVNTILLKSSNKDMNIGYKFLQPTTVNLKKEDRTGTWKDINEGQSAEAVQNTFLSIVQPHDDENSTYAYVLYPNRDENEFSREVASDDIKVIENSETNQVIYDKKNKIYGVVKYDDSELKLEDGLILKEKGIYTIRKDTDKIEVAFLNPDDRSSGIQELKADKYTLNNATEPTVENSVRYYTYVLAAETPAESTEESSQTNAQTTAETTVTSKETTSVNAIISSENNQELPDTGTNGLEITLIIAAISITFSIILSKKRLQK